MSAFGFGGGLAANSPVEPASADSVVTDAIEIYIVQPGDTLWGIASTITPAGGDVRDTVDYLSTAAGGADLEIGQRIIIDHAALG
ncbi:MAG: LysM peptidoglycan-binding domain-containing protein [Acidimicrobiales bacterium]|nr:LysM domain-containing protein [Acidimicrobiia bacterium]NNC80281.1 LysM peptidoglycan-binding domain-containing protein [Acidimicrobiales bacterium]RZV47626.1 MAG: LysM peptidoglycan-binding domain-containing protein [Acidimicrobiales bacterium]